ncbi:MAG: succinate--CoA ligase subunit beta [Deltaproteobacteria bacterium]|nr:succinate--CoA ligase subunit beta [Deltaproteobacteria bacterium]
MKLYEYEAKKIFEGAGISIPRGALAASPEQVRSLAEQLKGPIVLKPQTLSKQRGKAGLIGFADTPQEAEALGRSLFGRTHEGELIDTILVEEKVLLKGELYLGMAVDYPREQPVILLSPSGGIEIETLSQEKPGLIKKWPINISQGLTDSEALTLAQFIYDRQPEAAQGGGPFELKQLLLCFYEVFRKYDCELAEINPLGIREDGSFIALDGALVIDDEAQFRHPELLRPRAQSEESFKQEQAYKAKGWTYIQMGGEIGILSSGAGITMAILDLIHLKGGKAANFLDTAQMNRQGIYEAFQIFHNSTGIRCLLINIFAGLNRCDELADGIKDYLMAYQPPFPIVVRMVGNREKEGREILERIGITPIAGLEESIDQVIALVRGPR